MNKVTKAICATAVGLALAVTPALTASAATNAPYVTKSEFSLIEAGLTRTNVSDIFGTGGRTVSQSADYVWKEYRIAYGKKSYNVDIWFYADHRGTYRVESWDALWTYNPSQSQDPATKTEFSKIKIGQSLDKVRGIIGSFGTIWYDAHSDYGDGWESHQKSFLWPSKYSTYGDVDITFERNGNGTYVVTDKTAFWG